MHNLRTTLENHDSAILPVLAQIWGVKIDNLNPKETVDALYAAMLDDARAERVWEALDDTQRGALQTVLGGGGKMALAMFTRMYGEIRKMGAGRIEREKPHQNPATVAEALFYRGLIAEAYEQGAAGLQGMIYVPTDLAAILPTHKTGYANLETAGDAPEVQGPMELESLEDVERVQQADTSIVDDMTTLLAYLQLYSAEVEGETIAAEDRDELLPNLLVQDEGRLAFLVGVGIGANLIDLQEGRIYPQRAEARRWLSDKRAAQVKALADAWRRNTIYRDLWHVPGLHPEPTGWPYDPVVAREAILRAMNAFVPKETWWSLEEFIFLIKEEDPDFQRPGGDYESWYIRNETGDYLTGFESWDAVEGSLLEFYVTGPMHWLGLVDLGEDAARLTVYGRAFVSGGEWPAPPEAEEKVTVQPNGMLLASRKVPRLDRFQLARFTTWDAPGTLDNRPYAYRLDAEGIQQAAEQGINTGHIAAFIGRMLDGGAIPGPIAKLLETWQGGATASVTMERLLVLRTTSPETMNYVFETPALRRYLGARLGPMACIVRETEWEALRAALGEKGIQVEISA